MPNGSNITKKQHYIPQTYLRGFSNDGKMICCYDLIKKTERSVPIQSILYREYLYEIRNQEGELCYPNQIEKNLSQIESLFANYRKRLEKSVTSEQNYYTKYFLNQDEKKFWKFYISLQMIRHEDSIRLVTNDCLKNVKFPNQIRAQNTALLCCLPFVENLSFYQEYLRPMTLMFDHAAFAVFYDQTGSLFTNEKAGCFVGTGKVIDALKEWKFILFPISRHISIHMYNMDVAENQQLIKDKRNILRRFDKEKLQFVKQSIAEYANKVILSPAPFSQDDKKCLLKYRKTSSKE